MPAITLKDILIGARQEAAFMQHYYLGIEHLFVAMLQIQGGLTRTVLEQIGFNADQIIYAIRLRTDRGTERRQWAGMPYTPRTEVVLDIAGDLAREAGRAEANERDVLDAILAERDSLPIRVMKVLGLSIDTWLQAVIEHQA